MDRVAERVRRSEGEQVMLDDIIDKLFIGVICGMLVLAVCVLISEFSVLIKTPIGWLVIAIGSMAIALGSLITVHITRWRP